MLLRRLRLARDVLAVQAIQPATALWRVLEMEVLLERLPAAGGRGLDLGCGDGTLAAIYLAPASAVEWTGLDLDVRDAALAARSGRYRRVVVASADAVPMPADSVDLVLANSSLEHMHGLDGVIAEAARVLRPGGTCVFTVPDALFHERLLVPAVLRRLGARGAAERYLRHLDRRLAHVGYLSPARWRELLAAHGLAVVEEVPYLSRRAVRCWEMLSNLTGGLAYLLAGGRRTPRQIQAGLGLLGRPRRGVGLAALLVFLPWFVVALSASSGTADAARLYRAERRG